MKLGISMWSYVAATRQGLDIPGFIREAKRLGVDGVELLDFFWKDRRAEQPAVEAALRETGLTVGVYSVSNNFAQDDPRSGPLRSRSSKTAWTAPSTSARTPCGSLRAMCARA